MARNGSNSASKPLAKSGGGTLVGMFIGLVLGVCLAAGFVWFINSSHSPFVNRQNPEGPALPANGKDGATQKPLALSGKPGDPMPQKRFDFHDILTGKQESMPENKPAEKKAEEKKSETKKAEEKQTAKPEQKAENKAADAKDTKETKEIRQNLYFQAGSFSSAEEADNQKARLALMGVEAAVLQVMLQEKTFYRVRIGPYSNAQEAARTRAELAKNGIDVTLIPKEQ